MCKIITYDCQESDVLVQTQPWHCPLSWASRFQKFLRLSGRTGKVRRGWGPGLASREDSEKAKGKQGAVSCRGYQRGFRGEEVRGAWSCLGQWLGQGGAGRGGCSLLEAQELQVEQMRAGEEEVKESSTVPSVYELRGNGLHASFHLFLLTGVCVSPETLFVWNQSWLTAVLSAFFSFEMDLYCSQAMLL